MKACASALVAAFSSITVLPSWRALACKLSPMAWRVTPATVSAQVTITRSPAYSRVYSLRQSGATVSRRPW